MRLSQKADCHSKLDLESCSMKVKRLQDSESSSE